MWRPIVLYVNVGESSFCPTICPYGTRPSLINAWNPLQIPRASPSRSLSNFSTASVIFAFWNAVAKNFAEPSGSSPALNPPGNIIIWAWEIAFSNSSTDSRIPVASKFLNTFVMTLAPALSKAFLLSYSQFVPGKTGINTVGWASLWLQIWISDVLNRRSLIFSSLLVADFVANTFSNGSSHAALASARVISASPYLNSLFSLTSPIIL